MSKLSTEERQILKTFEKGGLKRSENAAETQQRHQEYAKALFRKDAAGHAEKITLSKRDAVQVLELLENPPEPSPALLAVAQHRHLRD